jgi:hypothetical protein
MGQLQTVNDILETIQSGNIQPAIQHFTSLPPDERRQFLEEVGSLRSEAAARLLTALFPTIEQKDLQKTIKKLLFLLKTVGIRVEEPVAAGDLS